MHLWARPWRSRWVRLSLLSSLVLGLLLVSTGVAGAQATLPSPKSTQAEDILNLYYIVFGVGAAIFVIVEAMIIFVALRYRRKDGDELPPQIHGNTMAEIVWTGIPTIIVVIIFAISYVVLEDVTSGPAEGENVVTVDVTGRQWAWSFAYGTPIGAQTTSALSHNPEDESLQVDDPGAFTSFSRIRLGAEHMRVLEIDGNRLTVARAIDGTVTQTHAPGTPIDSLFNGTEIRQEERLGGATPTPVVTVPVGTTVRFDISSEDVIHAFYTPQFLYKIDATPGRINTMWVKVTEAGFYESQCAEFCGREHARMLFTVNALPQAEFDAWFEAKSSASVVEPPPDSDGPDDGDGTDDGDAAVRGRQLFFAIGCQA
ncbi:MAG: cytochrome c oxidase subunit II, partial [Chloroflexi bacterium]|nr:cytochrome c oxidase subunit II [Chloroflexota bacterium]